MRGLVFLVFLLFFLMSIVVPIAVSEENPVIIVYNKDSFYSISYYSGGIVVKSNDKNFNLMVDSKIIKPFKIWELNNTFFKAYSLQDVCGSRDLTVISNSTIILTIYNAEDFPWCNNFVFSAENVEGVNSKSIITTTVVEETKNSVGEGVLKETSVSEPTEYTTTVGNRYGSIDYYGYIIPLGIGGLAFIISYYIVKNRI